jgi:hypothetical protein
MIFFNTAVPLQRASEYNVSTKGVLRSCSLKRALSDAIGNSLDCRSHSFVRRIFMNETNRFVRMEAFVNEVSL